MTVLQGYIQGYFTVYFQYVSDCGGKQTVYPFTTFLSSKTTKTNSNKGHGNVSTCHSYAYSLELLKRNLKENIFTNTALIKERQ